MLQLVSQAPFVFSADALEKLGAGLRDSYVAATPFPHAVVDDFLPRKVAERLLRVFPRPDDELWLDWRMRDVVNQPRKQGIGHVSRLEQASPWLHNMLQAFNSWPFLAFLETLTGIEQLLPDPHLHGGGCHQILPGGKLSVHTDSNYLVRLDLYRRINVLLYLNKDWKPEYHGDLELWDASVATCVKSIAPLFNRLVVFNTTKKSFHGHPQPLATPEGVTRKSLALYYYTAKPAPDEHYDQIIDWQVTPSKDEIT
jgi:hypothetical protein